jgi:hypothetical protein
MNRLWQAMNSLWQAMNSLWQAMNSLWRQTQGSTQDKSPLGTA